MENMSEESQAADNLNERFQMGVNGAAESKPVAEDSKITEHSSNGKDEKALGSSQTDSVRHLQTEVHDNLNRAALFLSHPSVTSVPEIEKDSYLRSKGLSPSDILRAKQMAFEGIERIKLESAWKAKVPEINSQPSKHMISGGQSHDQQIQHHSGNPHDPVRQHYAAAGEDIHFTQSEPELPNPLVPLTIGGIFAVYGMAVLRWLNGGDFVLFPPSSSIGTSGEALSSSETSPINVTEENTINSNSRVGAEVNKESEEKNFRDMHEVLQNNFEDDYIPAEDDIDGSDTDNPHFHDDSQFFPDNKLAQDIRTLSLAIEKFSDIQERNLKDKLDEKAKLKTDNAMEMLAKKREGNSVNNNSRSKTIESLSSIDIHALLQLTELKCDMKAIFNLLESDTTGGKFDEILAKLGIIRATLQNIETSISRGKETLTSNSHGKDLDPSMGSTQVAHAEVDVSKTQSECIPSLKQDVVPSNVLIDEGIVNTAPIHESSDITLKGNIEEEEVCSTVTNSNSYTNYCQSEVKIGMAALATAIENMKENNDVQLVKSSCQMLFLYISNLAKDPTSERYRKIYTTNNTFKSKIGNVKFAKNVLLSVGFVEHESYLEWNKNASESGSGDESEGAADNLKEAVKMLQGVQSEFK